MQVYAINFGDPTVNPVAQVSSLGTILNVVIPIISVIAGLIFLFMLISGAFMYITSGDSPEQVKKAQSTFFTAIVGLLIVVLSYFIVQLLGYMLNVKMMI